MSRRVYQLEGQQLRSIQSRAIMIERNLTGNNSNLLRAIYEATQDALQIEELVRSYLEQPTVEADD